MIRSWDRDLFMHYIILNCIPDAVLDTHSGMRRVKKKRKQLKMRASTLTFTFVFCFRNFVILVIAFGIFDLGISFLGCYLQRALKVAISVASSNPEFLFLSVTERKSSNLFTPCLFHTRTIFSRQISA